MFQLLQYIDGKVEKMTWVKYVIIATTECKLVS